MEDRALITVHTSLFRRDRPLITVCTSHSRRSLYRALLTEDRARVTEDKALLTEYRALFTVHTLYLTEFIWGALSKMRLWSGVCTRISMQGSFKGRSLYRALLREDRPLILVYTCHLTE